MRLRHTAAVGLAAGALVLSGGLAMAASADSTTNSADSSGTTDSPTPTTTAAESGTSTATTESGTSTATTESGASTAPTESGTSRSGVLIATTEAGGTPFTVAIEGDDDPAGQGRIRRMAVNGTELTDDQRDCMEKNGAGPPDFKPGDRPSREDMEAHRAKIEAAMDECGIEHPDPGQGPGKGGGGPVMIVGGEQLTDEQRTCMEENAPKPPVPSGERPGREDMEKMRSQMEAAMDECDVDHPKPGDGPRGDVVYGTAPAGGAGPAYAYGTTQPAPSAGTAVLTPAGPADA